MQVRGFERYIFLSILLILFLSPDICFNKLSIFPNTFQESHQNIKPVLIQSRRNILSGSNDLQWLPYQLSTLAGRIKSGNVGHQVNSDSDHVCFIF